MIESLAAILMHGSPFKDLPTSPPLPVCEAGQVRIDKLNALLVLMHAWLQSDELHAATNYEDSDRYLDAQATIEKAQAKLKLQSDRLGKICSGR